METDLKLHDLELITWDKKWPKDSIRDIEILFTNPENCSTNIEPSFEQKLLVPQHTNMCVSYIKKHNWCELIQYNVI